MALLERNGIPYLRRRVPRRYAAVEPRREVWISLESDSETETEARAKADVVGDKTLAAQEAKMAGDTDDAERQFQAARNLAKAKGFRYRHITDVAQLPLPELLDRVEAIRTTRAGRPDMKEARALPGAVQNPPIKVGRALEIFRDVTKVRTLGKSADEVRRWIDAPILNPPAPM